MYAPTSDSHRPVGPAAASRKWQRSNPAGTVACGDAAHQPGSAAANPKNLLLAVAGAAAIAQTGIAGGQQALAYLVFAVIATIGAAIPMIIYFAMGKRSESPWLHTFPQFSGRISVTARRFRDHLTVG